MTSILVYEDNRGAIKLTVNPSSSARSRHVNVHHYFLRMLSVDGVIRVIHVASREQHADTLTKSLGEERFKYHHDALIRMKDSI